MSKINRHPVRRTAAGVLAGALALSGAVAAATPAFAAPGFALDRLAGDNRYETSAAIAAAFGPSTGAILASGEVGRSVDALSANFLAGVQGVPVLLTERDRIPASVLARLNALTGAKNVTIVGGTVAVSAAVETQLRTAGFTVTRLGGADRFATSEEIIKAGAASASQIGLVASGTSFPDALAGGPLSYKGKHPVFLTSGSGIPQDTIDAMVAAGTRQVIILGGTAAVPASVQTAIEARGITVLTRLGGAGRSETSRIIADYLITNQGFVNTTFNVASGVPRGEGVDALSGAALSGKQNRTLLVTDSATSAGPVVAFAQARSATLNAAGNIFGGTAAVAAAVETQIETAGVTLGANQTFTLTPGAPATLGLANEGAATAAERDADNRTYSVATPAAGATHTIVLVPAANVTVAANGAVSFADAETAGGVAGAGNNEADLGTVAARIVSVNSVPLGAPAVSATAVPVAGTITFTVEGNAVESVVPVVFFDADADGQIDLDANNRPVAAEVFGIGSATTYTNPAAASQSLVPSGVERVNKTANTFDAAGFVFTYDANDTFSIGGLPATLDEFEAALSSGDNVSATYTTTTGLASTFSLTDANPGTPAAPAFTVGVGASSNDVELRIDVVGDVDQVQIQRAPVTAGVVGTFATVATEPATDDDAVAPGTTVVYADNNLAAGTYRYRTIYVNDGDAGTAGAATADVVTTSPAAADTTAPTAVATTLTTDAGFGGVLDAGDVFTLRASEALAAVGRRRRAAPA